MTELKDKDQSSSNPADPDNHHQGGDGATPLRDVEKAEQAHREGRSQEAYDLLAEFLSREPDHPRALLDKAVVCHSLGRADEAVETFERILTLDAEHLEARRSLAVALASLQRWSEAESHLAFLLDRRPEDHALWAYQAKVVKAQGRRDEALAHIERAVRIAPRQADYAALRSELSGQAKPRLVLCCAPGMDNFVNEILNGLKPHMRTQAVVSAQVNDHLEGLRAANVVWLEWGNQLTAILSKQHEALSGKQVIVRIHSYEIIDRLADNIDFSRVTDVVFVAAFMRDLFLARRPEVAEQCRVHVIHNGLDLKKFAFVPRSDSRRHIAFLAYISHKKDPMAMLQAFAFLRRRHPDLHLHIAGAIQDARYALSMPHFIEAAGLTEAVTFYGHINNADEWLKDKDYILSSSPLESQGVGLLEAMSRSCRPLLYRFPGAADLYLPGHLWTTFDDLEELFLHGPEPEEVSGFVARHYSRDREIGGYLKVILDKEQVDEVFDFTAGRCDLAGWGRILGQVYTPPATPAAVGPAPAAPAAQPSDFSSSAYWENRYAAQGNSGAGSYGRLAEFKAEILNAFVAEHGLERVMEFGSGDGNQLTLMNFKKYTGFDVSHSVLQRTRQKFAGDPSKTFLHTDLYSGQTAELTLSLDVIYHLVEDGVYEAYMHRLFEAAEKYVIIYASDADSGNLPPVAVPHVKHRGFLTWVRTHMPGWECVQHIPNRYPMPRSAGSNDTLQDTSFADFYIFRRRVPGPAESSPGRLKPL